jgi:flagellar biosynthetic protein FlhB
MSSDRTEKATPQRREDAKRKGQIARRPELPAAASFLAALTVLNATGEDWAARASSLFTGLTTRIAAPDPLTATEAHGLMISAVVNIALLSMPVIAVAMAASLAGNFAQGGISLTPEALMPKAERFNPIANLKRSLGPDRIVDLIKQSLILGGVVMACYGVFMRSVTGAAQLIGAPAAETLKASGELLSQLGMRAGGVLLVLAVLDYGYGLYKHEKSLRMTKQEVKDEYRQQEGDPMVKALRRRAARALVQRQITVEVPRADVVVTNPTHFAVALRYDREADAAPVVVAKGADLMAKRIRELAKEHDVPVIENPLLARALYKAVGVSGVIPPDLFRAVAELLAYVYRQRDKAAKFS